MMRRTAIALGIALLSAILGTSRLLAGPSTPPCPQPAHLELQDLSLPLARAALAQDKKLVILSIGGAATEGSAAGDPMFTYPARLQADLIAALPGMPVTVVTRTRNRRDAGMTTQDLPIMIRESGARLVIWATGAREAASSADIDDYVGRLEKGIDAIHLAGADLILLDMQYAPSIARIVNFGPYRDALLGTAAARDIPVLRRYELMMQWSDAGVMNLDAQDNAERRQVARQLFGCIAAVLSSAIAQAVK